VDPLLDTAIDEIARLRTAIETHREAVCSHPRSEWLDAIDLALWYALKESK
jgi:hypothetical protein